MVDIMEYRMIGVLMVMVLVVAVVMVVLVLVLVRWYLVGGEG